MDEQIIKMASHMRSGKSQGCVFEVWNRRCMEKKDKKGKNINKKKLLLMPCVQVNSSEKKAAQD